jgi:hypothetical protein
LRIHGIALVEGAEALELALRGAGVHAGAQHGWSKPERCICTSWSISTSPVARRSPAKPRRRRSRNGLAVGAAVGELGEVQVDALHALQRELATCRAAARRRWDFKVFWPFPSANGKALQLLFS